MVPSRRDLDEIRAVDRRRRVTALQRGTGGDVEAPSRGRALVVGLALAVLLVAGAAVTGVLG